MKASNPHTAAESSNGKTYLASIGTELMLVYFWKMTTWETEKQQQRETTEKRDFTDRRQTCTVREIWTSKLSSLWNIYIQLSNELLEADIKLNQPFDHQDVITAKYKDLNELVYVLSPEKAGPSVCTSHGRPAEGSADQSCPTVQPSLPPEGC